MNAKNQPAAPVATEDTLKGMQSVDMTVEVGASICLERTGEILRLVKIEGDMITFEKIN
ncbi:MAG: hypothetical protein HY342_11620 [Candidatus Lambdaproteobacteria bacterium]|nr:hypothetical protein [Candidatus Lambdaproteobacteria bacterium]